jgi:hypothetical protein
MRKFQFDKELIERYGEQLYREAKVKREPLEVTAKLMVYIAEMCGEIAVDMEDKFYFAIIKAAKKHGRVDKRSWHKQHP